MFSKAGEILNNPVDSQEFCFDCEFRTRKRKEFHISRDTIVVGHIGRLCTSKNQSFLIHVFAEFKQLVNDSLFIMVGHGEDQEMLEQLVNKMGLQRSVIFTGDRTDVNQLLSMIDIMVFPSLTEGLPVMLIEAQFTKLPCLISDGVPLAVKFNENVEFLSLSESFSIWAKHTLNLLKIDRHKIDNSKLLSSYDIDSVSRKLYKIYTEEL